MIYIYEDKGYTNTPENYFLEIIDTKYIYRLDISRTTFAVP